MKLTLPTLAAAVLILMSPDGPLNGQTVSPEEIEAAQKQQYDEIDRYLDSQEE